MKLVMKYLLRTSLFFILFTGSAHGATRNCTQDERPEANEALISLQNDSGKSQEYITRHLPLGVPIAASKSFPEDLLVQSAFIMTHDIDLKTATWVGYELTSADVEGASGNDRVNCFRRDPRYTASKGSDPSDYDESIFDQGHMVSDADTKDDLIEQINTYVQSNMAPQYCRFNRGAWLSLEHFGRIWAKKYGQIFIMSGAAFDADNDLGRDSNASAPRMKSRNGQMRVGIPSHFYKVFLREEEGQWHSISFLMEQNNDVHGTRWADVSPYIEKALVTIEDIEGHTDLDIFPDAKSQMIGQNEQDFWDLSTGQANLEGTCN
jgi:endonuclease G, mitochondrial